MGFTFLFVLGLLVAFASGAGVQMAVHGRINLDLAEMRTVRLHLQGTSHTGISRQDGSFTIHNVPVGTYTLEVIDPVSVWPQLEVDVGMRSPGRVQVFSTRKDLLPYPFQIDPLGKADYFEKREGFNPRSLLMNPMMLTMGVSLISVFLLPQLVKNMDPEALKQMQDLTGGEKAAEPKPEPKRVTAK